jgi:hypothetical protein
MIAACNKMIALKVFSGGQLATIYFWRAVGWNKKGDHAQVIGDATEALRPAPAQAIYNLRTICAARPITTRASTRSPTSRMPSGRIRHCSARSIWQRSRAGRCADATSESCRPHQADAPRTNPAIVIGQKGTTGIAAARRLVDTIHRQFNPSRKLEERLA